MATERHLDPPTLAGPPGEVHSVVYHDMTCRCGECSPVRVVKVEPPRWHLVGCPKGVPGFADHPCGCPGGNGVSAPAPDGRGPREPVTAEEAHEILKGIYRGLLPAQSARRLELYIIQTADRQERGK